MEQAGNVSGLVCVLAGVKGMGGQWEKAVYSGCEKSQHQAGMMDQTLSV